MSPCLKFLRFSSGKNAERDLQILDKAANFAESNKIDVKIIKDAENIQELLSKKKDSEDKSLYVCFPFEGKIFENLKEKGYQIVGPQCVLSCLLMEISVPKQSYPICNVAMLGVVACCSSMKKDERQSIHQLVLVMGGLVSSSFTSDVTHLIAKEVGSKKYQVACTNSIPVLLPSWVHETWEKSQYDHILASNLKDSTEYIVPIFKGCTICVTGIDAMKRDHIKSLISNNGGTYSGELNMKTCTHLLCEQPKGQKYVFAKQWKLHCVYPLWLYDCLKKGHWIEETSYQLEPIGSDTKTMSESMMQHSRVQNTFYESNKSRLSMSKRTAEVAAKSLENSMLKNTGDEQINSRLKFKTFNATDINLKSFKLPKNNGNYYLDGCKIYLCNKTGLLYDCCRKIINDGGGIRFSSLSDAATHIVLWDTINKDIRKYLTEYEGQLPHVVSPLWLVESCMQGEMKQEKDYVLLIDESGVNEFKDFAIPNKSNISNLIPAPPIATSLNINFEEDQGDDTMLMNQYLTTGNHESTRLSQVEAGNLPVAGKENKPTQETTLQGEETETIVEPVVQIFEGKRFTVKRFDDEQVVLINERIEEFGGQIVEDINECDYIVVPLSYQQSPLSYQQSRKKQKKEVTICWVEQCCEQEIEININSSYLFRPIHIPCDVKPLINCYISISQFCGVERQHLFHLASLLGGTGQECFVRNNSADMNASTHLILKMPEGTKYNAAKKWGVPAVSKKWLIKSCKNRKRMVEEEYPVIENNDETLIEDEAESDDEFVNNKNTSNYNDETVPEDLNGSVKDVSANRDDSTNQDVSTVVKQTVDKSINKTQDQTTLELSSMGESMMQNIITQQRKSTSSNKTEETVQQDFTKFNKSIANQVRSPLITASLPIKPNLEFEKSRYSFDFTDALDSINSPAAFSQDAMRRKSRKSRGSLPFDLQFIEAVQKAVDRHVPEEERMTEQEEYNDEKQETDQVENQIVKHQQPCTNGILKDCCIIVSKKLSNRQMELHHMVYILGGETKFIFDNACTHFIHQGRLNDTSKDYIEAKKKHKFLVSPCWLEACVDSNMKVSEDKYPVNFNPRMSIDVSANRSTRSSKLSPVPINNNKSPIVKSPDLKSPKVGKSQDEFPVEFGLDYQKKMEEIMEATKAPRNRKSSRKQVNTSKNDSSSGLNVRKLRTRSSSQKSIDESPNSDNIPINKVQPPESLPDQSQSDYITYDDPTGRVERERILAQLKRASPSQDIEAFHYAMEKKEMLETINRKMVAKKSSSPDAPPMGPPLVNDSIQPEAINLLSDDEEEKENIKRNVNSQKYRFLMSGMNVQEKIDYAALIERLGGEVFDVQYFNPQCTHVILNAPSRNEKYLAAVSSGKWALHKSFLEASRESNRFVDEAEHEWGSHKDCSDIASAAKRWRLELVGQRKKNASAGAFSGWVVLLCIEKARQPGFKRILEAGGAKVNHVQPPFNNTEGATHAIIGDKNLAEKTNVNYEHLHSMGIWILKPEYITDFLSLQPTPPTFNYVIDEVKHLNEQSITVPTPGKRKAPADTSIQKQKRTRRK